MKPNSCPTKGNNPTALSAWLFPSICFTAHNHKTLNRPFSAVLTEVSVTALAGIAAESAALAERLLASSQVGCSVELKDGGL